MSLLFMDGCDLYTANADASEAGWASGGGTLAIQSGRFNASGSGRGALAGSGAGGAWERNSLSPGDSTFIAQFAFQPTSMASTQDVVQLFESTNQAFVVELLTDGSLRFRDSADSVLATTAAGLVLVNRWHYLEIKLTNIGDSGEAWVRLDGNSVVCNIVGVDLMSGSTPQVDRVVLGQIVGSYDDIVLMDGVGMQHNDVLGDCRISTLRPTSTVDSDDWTPTPDTDPDDHQAIDDSVPGDHDGDTSYMSATVDGNLALFGFESLDSNQVGDNVFAVAAALSGRYTGASGSVEQRVTSGSQSTTKAAQALTGSYSTIRDFFETDPSGIPWTEALVNALSAGFLHDGET